MKAKYPAIAAEIESRIHRGCYDSALPSVRELAREFRVSGQTITNALRPLREREILHSRRRVKVGINREHRSSGLIGLVSQMSAPASPFLSQICKAIEQDGFEPLLLAGGKPHSPYLRSLLGNHFAGLIFYASSLSVEAAEHLNQTGVPFVSCNLLPVLGRSLNYVEHDTTGLIRNYVRMLMAAGYREIGLFFSSMLESYNTAFTKSWRAIKTEFDLPPVPCDDYVSDWRDPDPCDCFFRYLEEKRCWPEALICYNGYTAGVSVALRKNHIEIPPQCLLVGVDGARINADRSIPVRDNIPIFQVPDCESLIPRAYEALRELIFGNRAQLIQRKYPVPVLFHPASPLSAIPRKYRWVAPNPDLSRATTPQPTQP